jgi:hypothetical protein
MKNFEEMQRFSNIILEKVKQENIEYIDAIVTYCEDNDLEMESILDLISPALKSKIEEEALIFKLIKSTTNRLDV